jgi:hypothetical protein
VIMLQIAADCSSDAVQARSATTSTWKHMTAGGNSETQALINSVIWENGHSQVLDSPNRGDALLEFTWSEPKVQSHLTV